MYWFSWRFFFPEDAKLEGFNFEKIREYPAALRALAKKAKRECSESSSFKQTLEMLLKKDPPFLTFVNHYYPFYLKYLSDNKKRAL